MKKMRKRYIPPPTSKIRLNDLEGDYWWVIQKICDILFSEKYNNYCVVKARSILDFSVKARMLTGKQIRFIDDLKPNR